MHFNYYSLFLIASLTLGLGYFENNVHAEAQVIDRIYLIVNSQMLTRSEAQDVAAAIQAQKSSAEKTKKELNEQLLMNLVQEMLLLDRAKALKIEPGVKEIESRLDQLADDQPQLLEVYAEEDLKEQLEKAGIEVETIPSSCCGMAGSFGYQSENYQVSLEMAELSLLPRVRKATNAETVVASGTSCRHQILHGSGHNAQHPISLLRKRCQI